MTKLSQAYLAAVLSASERTLELKEWIASDGAYLKPLEVYKALHRYNLQQEPIAEAVAKLIDATDDAFGKGAGRINEALTELQKAIEAAGE